ncbi:MAG TPA: M1 family metallopeptidase [Bacteroidia bacterium]|nr:M1 family metallopeptidase [Bacteroidia bacterium]
MIINDPHSYSKPGDVAVKHLHLNLVADFATKTLEGYAELQLINYAQAQELWLDSKDLTIKKITLDDGSEAKYELGNNDSILGQSIRIDIKPTTQKVKVEYRTSPHAEALQWLEPQQTAGKKHPFLFSQSQAILARTWIPLQDAPAVKFTYSATIKTDPRLMVLMSAENGTKLNADGVYNFNMPQPIPAYLMAITIGNFEYRNLGKDCGVYAEPEMIEKSAWEFADLEKMIHSAEELYGPYAWGKYDVIVLPPSFPFGGMENPRLTFATPTIIAGDRSLVSLVAHELAHSWSGNLVTNATWNDFWLNEGFTVYFERRIMQKIYGRELSEMMAALALGELKNTIAEFGAEHPDTRLKLSLEGRNPDDGVSDIAYEKGYFFLRTVEEAVGMEKWDTFVKKYFDTFAFKTMNTEDFLVYLDTELLKGDMTLRDKIQVDKWVYQPGLPANCPQPKSGEFDKVMKQVEAFKNGKKAAQLDTNGWMTQHWQYFLRNLPKPLTTAQMADLDAAFKFTNTGNSEIACDWFQLAIDANYQPAYPKMEEFLIAVGRRKFLKPLYGKLVKTPEGKEWAKKVYAKARPGYHAVSINTIDEMLGMGGTAAH